MTPASAKQRQDGSSGDDFDYDSSQFIQVNQSQLNQTNPMDQQDQQVTISKDNIGVIALVQDNVKGLDVDEFNIRANELYLAKANNLLNQTMLVSQAQNKLESLRNEVCIDVYDQMRAEQEQEES